MYLVVFYWSGHASSITDPDRTTSRSAQPQRIPRFVSVAEGGPILRKYWFKVPFCWVSDQNSTTGVMIRIDMRDCTSQGMYLLPALHYCHNRALYPDKDCHR